MAQILPPKTSLSNTLGQALGSGLSSGIQKGGEVGFQRGMVQNALSGLDKLNPNSSPLEKTKYLIQATAGLPDQGRILQALAPMLLGQGRNEMIFPEGGQPQQEMQGPAQAQQPAQTPEPGQRSENQKEFGGFYPRIKSPAEIERFSENYARQFNDPQKYAEGKAIAESQNNTAQNALNRLTSIAEGTVPELKAHPERTPFFQEELQKYSHLKDPNEIVQKARESFRLGTNRDLDSLQNGYVPGALRGGLQKAKGLVGITSAFAQGGQTRDQAVKNLSGSVKRLIDKGYEAEARGILSQEHKLSPTEVEELIHPLNEKTIHSINSIPEASKIPQASHAKRLDKLLEENFSKDESLLAIRHRLWNEKGYDWKEIAESMKKIEDKMSPFQKLEMTTIETSPPIQSLSDIFQGWDRFASYLSGAK
jgi:hypothetical protein